MGQELDDGHGVRIAFEAPVFIGFFYAPPTKERLDFLFDNERKWVGDMKRFCAISVIDPSVGKEMPADARQKAKEITEYWGERMICSITVVEGSGFFPALVRSVIAGIQLLSKRGAASLFVAKSIEEGVQLLEKHATGLVINGPEVAAAAERLVAPHRKQKSA